MQTSVNTSTTSSKKKKKPAAFKLHDEYFLKAKKEGYRARSVYKLIEIQEKFELIKP
jgi:23S rRNA (uridine2552-2'-O)-methyltransferase